MKGLYIVGTPIGNLGDFSPRAQQTLREVDFIAAEDTRVTAKLLNHFQIRKPLVSYYEQNKDQRGAEIAVRLEQGESCALVTDAGMPCISDPGYELVRLCRERGIPVESVPGPSAVVTALCVSGLPAGRFAFEGFLSVKRSSRAARLKEIQADPRTLVFYEAPHKLCATLRDMAEILGTDRQIAVVKELTKIHESVVRGSLGEAVSYFEENPPRGEYVLVLEGASAGDAPEASSTGLQEAVAEVLRLREQGVSLSEAAKTVAARTGLRKNALYSLASQQGNSE